MNTIVRNLATKSGYAVEAPNYKHQITNKFQRSKFQTMGKRFGHLKLKFGIYLVFGISIPARRDSGYAKLGMFADGL
jgi:hypothetical protein